MDDNLFNFDDWFKQPSLCKEAATASDVLILLLLDILDSLGFEIYIKWDTAKYSYCHHLPIHNRKFNLFGKTKMSRS